MTCSRLDALTVRLAVAAPILLLIACSDGGGDDGTTTAATATATTTTTATATDTATTSAETDPGTSVGTSAATSDTSTTTTTGPTTTDPTATTTGPTTTEPTTSTTEPTTTTDPTTGGDDGTLCASQSEELFFPADAWFYQDATQMPVAADSQAITQWMIGESPPNGWGTGTMRIDFSIAMMDAAAGTPKRTYETADGFYYVPDCDLAPMPIPEGGLVEDYPQDPVDPNMPFSGYQCSGFDDGADCHILTLSRSEGRLYELYHATIDGNDDFHGGCLAIWDLTQAPPPDGRGQQCTSADAAGFPIAPLLFTADEVMAGEINHAIRFILPNTMIRTKQYVAPATHGTNTTGPETAIPYGGHMRLRADYPIANLKPAAQVVAKALQKYGMYMADGGNIALTAASDATGCATWADVDLGPQDLSMLLATDFEVIDHGPTIPVTYECERTQILE